MESSKQQSIIKFFQKKTNNENQVSGTGEERGRTSPTASVSGELLVRTEEETNPTASNLQHGLKRSCNVDMDYAETSKKRKGDFIRQYDNKYLEHGFTIAPSSEKVPLPMCLVCAKILSNDAMKPSKLRRHFHSRHSNLVGKPLAYFKRLLSETENERTEMLKMTTTDKALLKSSYLIALQISKTKKPYTIGEDLVKPCMIAAATEVLGPGAANKLQAIPLSNDTVQRRIMDMAVDVEQQVIEQVKESKYFAIQLDESTDLSNCAILNCFVRYENEGSIIEEFLCCLQLPGRTTSSEIFRSLNNYVQGQGLDWGKCVGVCTDGAANMTGCHSGVTVKIREVANKDLLITHCILHRESLSAKKLSPELNDVMNGAVKIINVIRGRALHSRLFEDLCDSIGSQHKHLLFHAEVRWLSRGRILARLFELREETKQFLREINSQLNEFLSDEMWTAKLAYLADIFSRLNDLNSSLQGTHTNIFTLRNKTDAFKKKLEFWSSNVQKGDIDMFPCLQDFVANASVNIGELFAVISQHLKELSISFDKYFPKTADPRKGNFWIVNPFAQDINSCHLNAIEKESLIELSCDTTLMSKHKDLPLSQFWISLKNEYPELSDKAMKLLLIFCTTYLSEKSFSSLSLIKTKQRNRVEVNALLRLAETSLEPRLTRMISNRQQQTSH